MAASRKAKLGKDIVSQIEKAGDTELIEFLKVSAPGFMMETKHGVDPLLGTTGLTIRQRQI